MLTWRRCQSSRGRSLRCCCLPVYSSILPPRRQIHPESLRHPRRPPPLLRRPICPLYCTVELSCRRRSYIWSRYSAQSSGAARNALPTWFNFSLHFFRTTLISSPQSTRLSSKPWLKVSTTSSYSRTDAWPIVLLWTSVTAPSSPSNVKGLVQYEVIVIMENCFSCLTSGYDMYIIWYPSWNISFSFLKVIWFSYKRSLLFLTWYELVFAFLRSTFISTGVYSNAYCERNEMLNALFKETNNS